MTTEQALRRDVSEARTRRARLQQLASAGSPPGLFVCVIGFRVQGLVILRPSATTFNSLPPLGGEKLLCCAGPPIFFSGRGPYPKL